MWAPRTSRKGFGWSTDRRPSPRGEGIRASFRQRLVQWKFCFEDAERAIASRLKARVPCYANSRTQPWALRHASGRCKNCCSRRSQLAAVADEETMLRHTLSFALALGTIALGVSCSSDSNDANNGAGATGGT